MNAIKLKQRSVIELIDKNIHDGRGIEEIMDRFRNSVIVEALTLNQGNVSHTAVMLQTSRNNLIRWMQYHKIDREAFRPAPHPKSQLVKDLSIDRLIAKTWYSMVDRCTNPRCSSYVKYGARGITVCEEWRLSKPKFIEWARLNGFSRGLQIDRINGKLGYSPDNCRFVTSEEQNKNRDLYSWRKL